MVPGLDGFLDAFHVMHAMQTLLHTHRIYTQPTRSDPLVLRIQPPLTITQEQVGQFVERLDETCHEIDHITRLLDGVISKSSIGEIETGQDRDAQNRSELRASQ